MNSAHFLIDIGANLTHPELNKKIDVIVDNIKSANIEKVIITSSNTQDTKEALEIISKYPDLFYTTVGFHPHNAKEVYSGSATRRIDFGFARQLQVFKPHDEKTS